MGSKSSHRTFHKSNVTAQLSIEKTMFYDTKEENVSLCEVSGIIVLYNVVLVKIRSQAHFGIIAPRAAQWITIVFQNSIALLLS